MGATSIEWTDHSINPIRARHIPTGKVGHYCEMISPGCAHCYASSLQWRFGTPEFVAGQKRGEFEIFLDDDKLRDVLKRRAPTKRFWEDMSDLFGEWVTDDMIDRCFAVMALTPKHTHQVLTKRAKRMAEYLSGKNRDARVFSNLTVPDGCWLGQFHEGPIPWPLQNVWCGVSVENQEQANERHYWLPSATVRWWSAEPLLGPIDFDEAVRNTAIPDWIVIGGESGADARPCRETWIRDLVRQCRDAEVPVFVKQMGGNAETGYGVNRKLRLKHPKGGDPSEWPADIRVREFPSVEVPL